MISAFWHSDLFLFLFFGYINLSLIFAFFIVFISNAVYSIIFLVLLFLILSFLFIFLGVEYLGLIFIIVYIGAIAILFLFIIMLLDLKNKISISLSNFTVFSFTLFILCWSDFLYFFLEVIPLPFFWLSMIPFSALITETGDFLSITDSLRFLSPLLYNNYFFYVVFCGFLLLFVMVGVILLLRIFVIRTQVINFWLNKYNIGEKKKMKLYKQIKK